MRKTRILSLLLCVAMLVGIYGGGQVSAAVTEWTAATVGQYINFDRYADLSTIVEGTSLVKGMTPYGSRYNSNPQHVNYGTATGSAIENLTDGKLSAQGTPAYTSIRSNSAQVARYFYFDLGAQYVLTDFIIASNQNGTGNFKFAPMRIYVADEATIVAATSDYSTSAATPLTGFNTPVFELTSFTAGQSNDTWTTAYNFHIRPTADTTVVGRYVCFELNANYATFDLDELAVYGTPYVQWKSVGSAGRFVHFSRYGTPSVEGKSLIEGMLPYGSPYGVDNYVWSSYNTSLPVSNMTNGVIGTNSGNDWALIRGNATTHRYLYFDLGATYRLSDFVVASAQHTGAENSLRNIKIYVAPTDADMTTSVAVDTSEYTLVYDVADYVGDDTDGNWTASEGVGNFHIQPTGGNTVVGRYVCFELGVNSYQSDTNLLIGELGVYGTAVESMGESFFKNMGGQVRSAEGAATTDLRFGFDMTASGVDYELADENDRKTYKNYSKEVDSAAKVTVDGVDYQLKDFGALVSLDSTVGLTFDDVDDVMTKDVRANNLYFDNGDLTTFTAVVVGIPETNVDTPIYVRPYAKLVIDGVECIVYGQGTSRAVSDCNRDGYTNA